MTSKRINIPHRMRVLLALIRKFRDQVTTENMQALLFMYCHYYANNGAYHFIPVAGKPISLQAQEDYRWFVKKGLLSNDHEVIAEFPKSYAQLDIFEEAALQQLKKYGIKQVDYQQAWDSYTSCIKQESAINSHHILYTIGYEGRGIEEYINTLLLHQIAVLCDVRYTPFSQKYGFSGSDLQAALALVNIQYIHMPELGVSVEQRRNMEDSHIHYNLLQKYEQSLPQKSQHLQTLLSVLQKHRRIAITCFERNYRACHRSKIASWLAQHKAFEYKIEHL
ncbi:MAG: DUF488 domain-containing protein [Proteobacteria bacterium]|nr:DUF488 domain-containing protein [Pseudomonadota bacterium]